MFHQEVVFGRVGTGSESGGFLAASPHGLLELSGRDARIQGNGDVLSGNLSTVNAKVTSTVGINWRPRGYNRDFFCYYGSTEKIGASYDCY